MISFTGESFEGAIGMLLVSEAMCPHCMKKFSIMATNAVYEGQKEKDGGLYEVFSFNDLHCSECEGLISEHWSFVE